MYDEIPLFWDKGNTHTIPIEIVRDTPLSEVDKKLADTVLQEALSNRDYVQQMIEKTYFIRELNAGILTSPYFNAPEIGPEFAVVPALVYDMLDKSGNIFHLTEEAVANIYNLISIINSMVSKALNLL